MATAPVVPQFCSRATVRAPAEREKRLILSERPGFDPRQRPSRGAVDRERDPLRRLRDLEATTNLNLFPDDDAVQTFMSGALAALRGVPGVSAVGATNGLPFDGSYRVDSRCRSQDVARRA